MPLVERNFCLRCWSLNSDPDGCTDLTHPRVKLSQLVKKLLTIISLKLQAVKQKAGESGEPAYKLRTAAGLTNALSLPTGTAIQEVEIYSELIGILSKKPVSRLVPFLRAHRMELFSLLNLYNRNGKMGTIRKHVRREDWLGRFARNIQMGEADSSGARSELDQNVLEQIRAGIGASSAAGSKYSFSQEESSSAAAVSSAVCDLDGPACYARDWIQNNLIEPDEDAPSNYLLLHAKKSFGTKAIVLVDISCKKAVLLFMESPPKDSASHIQVGHRLYFVGGSGKKGTVTQECTFFDFALNTARVRQFASLNVPREGHALAAINNVLYCVGGKSPGYRSVPTEKCPADRRRWLFAPSPPWPMVYCFLFVADSRYLFAVNCGNQAEFAGKNIIRLFKMDALDEEVGWTQISVQSPRYLDFECKAAQCSPTEIYIAGSRSGFYQSPARTTPVYGFDLKRNVLSEWFHMDDTYTHSGCSEVIQDGDVMIQAFNMEFVWLSYYFVHSKVHLMKKIPLINQSA